MNQDFTVKKKQYLSKKRIRAGGFTWKKNSYTSSARKKKSYQLKIPHTPHHFSNGPSLNGSLSDALVVARGVPQGSILGPILFSLYINDLSIGISNSNVDIYAGDTTIWETNSDPLLIHRGL